VSEELARVEKSHDSQLRWFGYEVWLDDKRYFDHPRAIYPLESLLRAHSGYLFPHQWIRKYWIFFSSCTS